MLYWKNVLVIIGMVFTLVFFWTLIFPLIGIPLWYFGRKRALARLAALERGQAAQARLVEVARDTSVKINGRSPWQLIYTFETSSGVHEGSVHAWEARHAQRLPGEAFWVVYQPDQPAHSSPWPPVK